MGSFSSHSAMTLCTHVQALRRGRAPSQSPPAGPPSRHAHFKFLFKQNAMPPSRRQGACVRGTGGSACVRVRGSREGLGCQPPWGRPPSPRGLAGSAGPPPASGAAAAPGLGSAWVLAQPRTQALPSAWPPESRCEPVAPKSPLVPWGTHVPVPPRPALVVRNMRFWGPYLVFTKAGASTAKAAPPPLRCPGTEPAAQSLWSGVRTGAGASTSAPGAPPRFPLVPAPPEHRASVLRGRLDVLPRTLRL